MSTLTIRHIHTRFWKRNDLYVSAHYDTDCIGDLI